MWRWQPRGFWGYHHEEATRVGISSHGNLRMSQSRPKMKYPPSYRNLGFVFTLCSIIFTTNIATCSILMFDPPPQWLYMSTILLIKSVQSQKVHIVRWNVESHCLVLQPPHFLCQGETGSPDAGCSSDGNDGWKGVHRWQLLLVWSGCRKTMKKTANDWDFCVFSTLKSILKPAFESVWWVKQLQNKGHLALNKWGGCLKLGKPICFWALNMW